MAGKSEYFGVCRFCGQQRMITVEDEVAKEYKGKELDWHNFLDEEATKGCNCEEARAHANVERRIENAKVRCAEIANGSQPIEQILANSITPLMTGCIDKLQVVHDGTKYETFLDSAERIHVKREYKNVDDLTE